MRTEDAFALLASLGATPWLVRHHELVGEAAAIVCDRVVRELGLPFDRHAVLLGAALHDAGKMVHPAEMSAPGPSTRPPVASSCSRICEKVAAGGADRLARSIV